MQVATLTTSGHSRARAATELVLVTAVVVPTPPGAQRRAPVVTVNAGRLHIWPRDIHSCAHQQTSQRTALQHGCWYGFVRRGTLHSQSRPREHPSLSSQQLLAPSGYRQSRTGRPKEKRSVGKLRERSRAPFARAVHRPMCAQKRYEDGRGGQNGARLGKIEQEGNSKEEREQEG